MSYPGYPPQGGYPPQAGGYPPQQGGYPPQAGGFPPQQGYPPQAGAYPPQGGAYPPQAGAYPPQAGAYPPQGGYPAQAGFPPQQGGYPPQAGGAYPPQGGAYPQQAGFPPQQGGFPPQAGFPPQQGGFPPQAGGAYPQQGGFPPQQGGYPQQGGFPPQQGGAYPQQGGFPPQQGGFPPQQQGGYPQQGGFPPQQQGGAYPQQGGFPPQQQGGYPQQQGGAQLYPQQAPPQQATPAVTTPTPTPTTTTTPAATTPTPAATTTAVIKQELPKYHGTVVPVPNHNPENDADVLRKAMRGMGTDEKAIIDIVGTRTSAQLKRTELAFKTSFGKDLMKDLNSEISGRFRDAVIARFKLPAEFDAWAIHEAISGAGTDERCLIEIIATRNNAEIKAIKDEYKRAFGKDLEKDVIGDTSGHFRRLLFSLLQGNRDETGNVDQSSASSDAQALYNAGEAKWGTDESKFNQILASRNFNQLRAIFEEYRRISKYDIERSIEREMSGDLKDGMLAVVQACKSRPAFFAEKIYQSMKGAGTDDLTLIRIIITRSEVDMVEIKQEFFQKYQKSLANMIEGDTSGDYKKLLIRLVGH